MNQIELIEKRKPREKHFLQKDGTIRAEIYDEDVHYLKDGVYEEIDNSLVKKNDLIVNKSNDFKAEFNEDFRESLMKMSKDNYYINFKIRDTENVKLKSARRNLSEKIKNVISNDINDDISIEYKLLSNKVKETIVLKNANYSKLSFILDTNLKLEEKDGEIIALDKESNIVFRIEKPYMVDSKNISNNNIRYLIKEFDDGYILDLVLDDEWLQDLTRKFPIYIDPTISNQGQNITLQDTYIYPGDNNDVRYDKAYLKAGVERINNTLTPNRTLIRFNLPTIGTGSEIVYANLDLTSYPTDVSSPKDYVATIHQITSDWSETTANWSNMNDKYNTKVESIFYGHRSMLDGNNVIPAYSYYDGNITNLVKKWYRNTPNYGLMIKSVDESSYVGEDFPVFFSTNNTISSNNPKPVINIVYRNQNGIEKYLDYRTHNFTFGQGYVNTYNGNLTTIFNLGHTIGGNMPVNLDLIYNTNDVILQKSTFFGVGFKLNLEQTIKEVVIDNNSYLEYIDENGTIHYFLYDNNNYIDEDCMEMHIEKNETSCIITDSNNTKMYFEKNGTIYRLFKIVDADSHENTIVFNENGSIKKVIDSFSNEIVFTYNSNSINIVSPDMTNTIMFSNDKINNITTANGTLVFSYNSVDCIDYIIDTTGIKYEYEYYNNTPYRIKKVIKYGINNTIGECLEFNYDYDSTNITEKNGQTTTLLYNSYGKLISENSMVDGENIEDAYSITSEAGESDSIKNKALNSEIITKYIKNYLKNPSFETDDNYFTIDTGITSSFDNNYCNSGSRSLKLVSSSENKKITQSISLDKGNNYTFSCYLKNAGRVTIELFYEMNNQEIRNITTVLPNTDFEREDISIYYDENATSNLNISVNLVEVGTVYIDDIQLEKGEIANGFNLIENSDFSEGYSEWDLNAWTYDETSISPENSFSIARFNNNQSSALKVSVNPTYGVSFTKTIPVKGKAGDLYTCSFWYKNQGYPGYARTAGSEVSIYFKPVGGDAEYCIATSGFFHPNEDKWQFFKYRSHAPEDFESIKLVFLIGREANDFYLTNLSLYKDVTGGEFSYDENGNLISMVDESNNASLFKYDINNQLIKVTNPLGKNMKYEYDNNKISRIINGISSSGISNQIIYDNNGNPIRTKITKNHTSEINNGLFHIRNKGTMKFLKAELNSVLLEKNDCSNTIWKIEQNGEYYKFIYSQNENYSISCENDNIVLSATNSNNFFKLDKQDNGSYHVIRQEEGATGTIIKFMTVQTDGTLKMNVYDEDSYKIEFYIEQANQLFLENEAEYTSDGRFLSSITDTNFNKKNYSFNPLTGLIDETRNSKGITTTYQYNNKKQLISVQSGNKQTTYQYNDKNLLSKIIQHNKEYNFSYDEFLKLSSISLSNSILYALLYDNYGNIIRKNYGNNANVQYIYDEFNRIKTMIKGNDIYNYIYDNHDNIAKIKNNDYEKKFYYDVSNRIYRYQFNDFKIKYNYNSTNDVVLKKYLYGNYEHIIQNMINDEDLLYNALLDNININYNYDGLRRLMSRNIENSFITNYNYISHGKRTSQIPSYQNIICNNFQKTYKYKYDEMNNITCIYENNNLLKKYYYDDYNELITEEDYEKNQIITYNYDIEGNLINSSTKEMSTNNILFTELFQYNNSWEDQLTNYNGISISYDSIGNPTSIGSNISLSWRDGRILQEYVDTSKNLNITYKYDEDGIRISKTVNGVETLYFFEDNDIIYENRGGNIIYYLYDLTGIIGLIYNNCVYYYLKNIQGDILGILDSNYNLIVQYDYDAWGNILSIKNSQGDDITDTQNIGLINPFRYRGYYYDSETNLYYLNSRYYNPLWKRFINADNVLNQNSLMLGNNLYLYSYNNPINYLDESGHKSFSITKWIKNKIIKPIERKILKACSTVAKAVGLKQTSNLFNKTLKDSPGNVCYGNNSQIVKDIKNSKDFKKAINTAIKNNGPNASFNNTEIPLTFKSPDLYMSLHRTTLYINGDLNDGKGKLSVTIKDTYDFDYANYKLNEFYKWPINMINNVAWQDQYWGLIETYDLTIMFDYFVE